MYVNEELGRWIGKFIECPRDTLEYETKGHTECIYMYS